MPRNPRYETFQNALVATRQERNFTQQEVAFRLGKPQSFVSKYESGERRLDVIEFLEVCRALDIKPSLIFERLAIDDGWHEIDIR